MLIVNFWYNSYQGISSQYQIAGMRRRGTDGAGAGAKRQGRSPLENRAVLAQRSATAFSYGENVAISIEPVGLEQTRVEVVSKAQMATNVVAPDWSGDILDKLAAKLD